MRAPRRVSTALVATVVPCTNHVTVPGSMPHASASAATPWRTAATGSPCRDGTLVATMPAREAATTSVKVPPMSIAR